MYIEDFIEILKQNNIDFFTGVPDSLLSPLCNYLINNFGCDTKRHVVAHNEGGCVGLAAGYYLATQKIPCVYMQNSGIGNATNPIVSLMHTDVYAIPALYIVGWRGEPDVKDEPQHLYQGKVCETQLDTMELHTVIISDETTVDDLKDQFNKFNLIFELGQSVALLIKKGALKANKIDQEYRNNFTISREKAIGIIADVAEEDVIISTTGKISRELFEHREINGQGHEKDFLTVGSMGHSSMIALGLAAQKPNIKVWCIDGDGAALMHMGSLSTIGNHKPTNLIHIVLNNTAHESVGGAPTCFPFSKLSDIARCVGYKHVFHIRDENEIRSILNCIKTLDGPIFIEICVSLKSRDDLGRPTTTPIENKNSFIKYVEAQK